MAFEHLVFVSPHFDDVVLSCSAALQAFPGAVVATVFSGQPDPLVDADAWDRMSGFQFARDAVERRNEEDANALRLFQAERVTLGFLNGPYRSLQRIHENPSITGPCTEMVARSLGLVLDEHEATRCAFPIGIFHDDHLIARNAARLALESRPQCQALVYCDLPYSLENKIVTAAQLRWFGVGEPYREDLLVEPHLKRRAVSHYRSQLGNLEKRFGDVWPTIFEPNAERLLTIK